MTKMTARARNLLGPKPSITPDEFERIWSIWPVGHKEDTYIQVAYDITHTKDYHGNKLTLEILITKYKAYVEYAARRNSDPKFTATLLSWMQKRRYNEELSTPIPDTMKRWIR